MFGAVAGVQLQTSRSIKPRERDLGDLRLFFLVRILTRPTNHPRHAACASNYESKPVRPLNRNNHTTVVEIFKLVLLLAIVLVIESEREQEPPALVRQQPRVRSAI